MTKVNASEMRAVEGGCKRHILGTKPYTCAACFLTCLGAGVAYLLGFRY